MKKSIVFATGIFLGGILANAWRQARSHRAPVDNTDGLTPFSCRPDRTSSKIRWIKTPCGDVRVGKTSGYFGENAVFVAFPRTGHRLTDAMAQDVNAALDGRFIMEPAPTGSSGGDGESGAIITAGLDYGLYQDGKQGYHKVSPPPNLDEVTRVLSEILPNYINVDVAA